MQIRLPVLSLSLSLFDFADSSRPRCTRDEKGALSLARVPAIGELAFASPGGAAFPCDWRRRSPPTRRLLPTCDNRAGSVSVPAKLLASRAAFLVPFTPLRRGRVDAFSLSRSRAAFPLPSRRPNDSPTSVYTDPWTRPRSPWPVGG